MENITYDVRIWQPEAYRGPKVTTYTVRWKAGDRRWKRPFRVKAQADTFAAELRTAARKGEACIDGQDRAAQNHLICTRGSADAPGPMPRISAGRRAPLRGLALITQGRPHPPAHGFRELARCCLRAVGDWGMDCSCRPVRCSRCRFLLGPVAGVCLWMRSVDLRLALGAVGDPGADGLCGIGEVPLADVFASRPVAA
jgi:hypothetical protein